jgi:CBS domain-containing protein
MIKKLLVSDVVTVFEGTMIQEVARIMDDKSIGMVVITERYSEGKPIGVITDRDIAVKAVKNNIDCSAQTVDTIMTRSLVTASETTQIEDAIKIMEESHIRRLLVLDDLGKVKGVVSLDDLVALLGNEINRLGNLCRNQVGTARRHHPHDFTRMA